jgi:hypothetical protein
MPLAPDMARMMRFEMLMGHLENFSVGHPAISDVNA